MIKFSKLYQLARQMNVTKEQLNSFKFFIQSKYSERIKSENNLELLNKQFLKLEEILPSEMKNKPDKKGDDKNIEKTKGSKNSKSEVVIVKQKYVPPKSKNRIDYNNAILLKLRIEYIRVPHSISVFAHKLYFDLDVLIEAFSQIEGSQLKGDSIIKIEYLKPYCGQIYDRMSEIIEWESEIVSPNLQKTKPNYFKVIYNSPGSKR
jgi:hypothetical protein